MIEIKQLTNLSIEEIHEAFKKAFADYVEPIELTKDQLQQMLERRGCDLNLSFGAINDNELVSFTLNGSGLWNGMQTAYDTGTGTVKEFRKKGLATQVFEKSLPVLRENGIEQYLLEVIKTNTKAFELYQKAGFEVSREFDYYTAEKEKLKFNVGDSNKDFQIKEIQNPDWERLKTFWDFNPSWQNSIDSIKRKFESFKYLGIYKNETLVGYGIIEKSRGDIPQIGIDKNYRRKGLAAELIKQLIQFSDDKEIQIINTESTYEPFRKFAKKINLEPGFGQYEMIMKL